MYTDEKKNNGFDFVDSDFDDEEDDNNKKVEQPTLEINNNEDERDMRKKKIIIILLLILIIIGVLLFLKNNQKDDNIKLSISNNTISVNENFNLNIVSTHNLNNVSWTSGDENIAKVTGNGKSATITGTGYGTTNIMASFSYDNYKSILQCKVTVFGGDKAIKLESVNFPEGELFISIDKSFQLNPEFVPDNSYIESIDYAIRDNNIATITKNSGLLQGLSLGKSVLEIKVNNSVTNSVNINVVNQDIEAGFYPLPSEIAFPDNNTINVEVGGTRELVINIKPETVSNKLITWKSSDDKVVLIKNGVLTGIDDGKATITASIGELSISKEVVVTGNAVVPSSITSSQMDIKMKKGDMNSINYSVEPNNTTVKDVFFKSSDPNVAMVDTNGNITGAGAGKCKIIITSVVDNRISLEINVTVTE